MNRAEQPLLSDAREAAENYAEKRSFEPRLSSSGVSANDIVTLLFAKGEAIQAFGAGAEWQRKAERVVTEEMVDRFIEAREAEWSKDFNGARAYGGNERRYIKAGLQAILTPHDCPHCLPGECGSLAAGFRDCGHRGQAKGGEA